MVTAMYETHSLTFLGSALAITATYLLVRNWYRQLVQSARHKVYNHYGETVPGQPPRILVGNIPDVYSAKNRLAAYNAFHQKFGEVVQIFWLWRQQLSVSNYSMARQILMTNQRNYSKFRPNSLLRKLFGHSILTSEGQDWKRQRLLMNQVFSKKRVQHFHPVFVAYAEQLSHQWMQEIEKSKESVKRNVYPDLTALFFDIIGKTAMGHDFAALKGSSDEFCSDEFLKALQLIEHQSTQPLHQFVQWWKYIPTQANRKLSQAFKTIDTVLYQLIHQQKNSQRQPGLKDSNGFYILDLLLQSTELLDAGLQPLTEKEVRDNLLAIIVNGHETVATTVAFSLFLLAQHPEHMARTQAEIDSVMGNAQGQLTKADLLQLHYLDSVLLEVLRYAPAVAGLQRIGRAGDVLGNWSTPAQQVVGITLGPLHRDSKYFGRWPEQFHPERYLSKERQCPLHKFWPPSQDTEANQVNPDVKADAKPDPGEIQKPLTFGDGARKCVGEHFALYEMKVVLATLCYHFDFQVVPNTEAELELGKFGLFLSTFPKNGVELVIHRRTTH